VRFTLITVKANPTLLANGGGGVARNQLNNAKWRVLNDRGGGDGSGCGGVRGLSTNQLIFKVAGRGVYSDNNILLYV